MNKTDRIFVAGGNGMVGSSIIRRLVSAGYDNIISNYFRKKPDADNESRVTFVELDLRRQEETEAFLEAQRPDYVFLSAAKVGGILANNTYRADFIYDNIMIAANVIHASRQYGVKKLLNLGSSCIYPKLAPQPLKEEYLLTGPLEPTNEPYAIAKIAAIKLCRYYNEQYGTNFISVMPTNLYGTGDNFNLETAHVLPALIRKFHIGKLLCEKKYDEIAADMKRFPPGFNLDLTADLDAAMRELGINGDSIKLWGSGKPFREFLFVDDLAAACIFLMEKCDAGQFSGFGFNNGPGEFINIGMGADLTIRDLAMLVKEIVGYKGDIEWDASKPDGTPRKLLDVSRMKSLGWLPETGLGEGIRKTYEWYLGRL
jgi:GDP-L-fucose synthase